MGSTGIVFFGGSVVHVDGAITASGLIVKAGSLATQGDAAEVLGFTPNMDDWYVTTVNYTGLQFKISTSHAILKDNISKDQKIHETALYPFRQFFLNQD
mgnify:CR=1 FL=1